MSNQIVKALEHAAEKIGKTLAKDAGKAVKDFYHSAGENLKKVAKNIREIEEKHAKDLEKLFQKGGHEVPHPRGHGGGGRHRGGPSGGRRKGRHQVHEPRHAARKEEAKCPGGEPVDMATGRMFIHQVDAELPGSLPLLFTRNFESGYQAGRWMGPRWTCTFDERLEIDAEGIVYLSPDLVSQAYPHPDAPGDPVFASAGARTELALTAKGDYTLTDPATGTVREFTLQPGGEEALLTKVRDRHGRHYTLAYDADGTPLTITHSGGYQLLVTIDNDRITALRLAKAGDDGHDALLMRYGYTDGHLTSVYNSSGKPMRFANDSVGRILSWTDRNNSQYRYSYDQFDRVVDEGGADGALRFHFTYGDPDPDTGLKLHTETNVHGHTTTYTVNEHGQVAAITDPLGHTTRFERDDYDRLLAETDPLGRTTRFAYDGAGDLITVTRPDGELITAAYLDGLSLPVTITTPGGAAWRQTYDEHGLCTSITDPLGAITTYTYDDLGHLASMTDALGNTTRIRSNPAGLPCEITDPTGVTTSYDYDAFGRTAAVTDPLGGVVRLTWTIEGHPASRTVPDAGAESWTYDGEGNCLTHTDPLGQTTSFEYTHFETLSSRTGPDGARITFTHDADMKLVAVTNALGQQWTYVHDAAGRLIGETDFHGRTVRYELDPTGQVAAVTNPLGEVTRYTNDVLGRPVVKDANGRVTTYGYDAAGHLTRAANPDAEVLRTVDPMGNLLTESVNGRTISHTRDLLGRRTTRTTPAAHRTTWTYDPAGRPEAMDTDSGRSVRFGYDAAGREQLRTIGRHLTLASAWDSAHRLASRTLQTAGPAGPEVLVNRAYRYRADGSLTGIDDRLTGRRSFEHDAAGRVTSVQAADWTEKYAYDPAGNLTDAAWPATDHTKAALGTRTYSGTQLSAAGRIRYEYDTAGRTTLRQVTRLSRKPDTWRYTWDPEDRLIQVVTPDGTRWRYLYDPFGRRIAKQRLAADSSTVEEHTDFTWDGDTLAEQTTHADYLPGPHTLSWDHHGLHPLAQTETISHQGQVDHRFFAIVTDLVGTPTELVDTTDDSIAWRAGTALWGHTTWPGTSSTYTPLRFPGQYFDPETRLHYNLNRYYDPETARYTTPDPLGLSPAPNPDAYVHNPHTLVDPLGLSPHPPRRKKPRSPGRLSDPLPQGLPKTHVHAYEEIRAGRGVPQTHPGTNTQKIFNGSRPHERFWAGAKEWRVPGQKDGDSWRILEKTLPDGRKVMGWTVDHYDTIHPFAAPHFPDSGWS